jgi:hypothetical protein
MNWEVNHTLEHLGILGAGEETSAVEETLEHTREPAGENLTTSTKEQWGNRRLPASPATRATEGRPSTTRGALVAKQG